MAPSLRVFVLLYVLVPGLLEAADLAVVMFPDGDVLTVDASIVAYDGPSVVETVNEGLRAEVRFDIQVYRDEVGFAGLIGDTLIAEYHPMQLGYWDPFLRAYAIERPDGTIATRVDAAAFVEELFTLRGYRVPAGVFETNYDYYILGRGAVVPIRLVSALSILRIFTNEEIEYTQWVRFPIPMEIRDQLSGLGDKAESR